MTPHKYPPLPTSQRDDEDRIGEILDTVRRIEARDTSYLRGQIEALVEESDRLRDALTASCVEWRNAMAVKDKAMHDLAMLVPTSPRGRIFAEVVAERERQEAKFPGQRLPLVEPNDEPGRIDLRRAVDRLRNRESAAREVCEARARDGSLTWLDVASEEFSEAMHELAKLQAGIGGKGAARAELIQVMAVCARILESEHFAEAPALSDEEHDWVRCLRTQKHDTTWDGDQDAADDNVVAEGGYTKGEP